MRIDERGRAYLDHRRQAGDTKTEAIRALRRRISDEVFRPPSGRRVSQGRGLGGRGLT